MKLNSALKYTDTDLQIGMETRHSSGVVTGMEGTCVSPTIWSQMFLHQCIIKKPVMDPWPAPIKIVKITDVLSMTRKDLELPSNISKLHSFNTLLH